MYRSDQHRKKLHGLQAMTRNETTLNAPATVSSSALVAGRGTAGPAASQHFPQEDGFVFNAPPTPRQAPLISKHRDDVASSAFGFKSGTLSSNRESYTRHRSALQTNSDMTATRSYMPAEVSEEINPYAVNPLQHNITGPFSRPVAVSYPLKSFESMSQFPATMANSRPHAFATSVHATIEHADEPHHFGRPKPNVRRRSPIIIATPRRLLHFTGCQDPLRLEDSPSYRPSTRHPYISSVKEAPTETPYNLRLRGSNGYDGGEGAEEDIFEATQDVSLSQHVNSVLQRLPPSSTPPVINGIRLIETSDMSDRFKCVFPFPLFNAIQSKCFEVVYRTDDNIVVSAPTGGGKTAILELAMCRMAERYDDGQFKIVYQAPTKSLCSERARDWKKKFAYLSWKCAELTGDTSASELGLVSSANVIVTTPEKWDSITRKWKDHTKLLQLVKLFLIDEVHLLHESRGATLEAIVSRMKTLGTNVRFVALSATIPNSQDIASWLGKNHLLPNIPAQREVFEEEFRPVKLEKHVYGFDARAKNDFRFESMLDSRLPELIARHTHKKPIMIFCFSRKSCERTAAQLSEWWACQKPAEKAWPSTTQRLVFVDQDLQHIAHTGVAFHHGGVELQDRQVIENAFINGQLYVICCTSTLAVGVNLPCHLVIIKGTKSYSGNNLADYSDLDITQMLGRAGRPQFEDSAVAIIMTRQEQVEHFERMVSGQDVLESTLHLNLVEHLNSEVALGTVYDNVSAKTWLSGTFLAVRIRQNPEYYNLPNGERLGNCDDTLRKVCEQSISLLREAELITSDDRIRCTEYGEVMTRYMVTFFTMKAIIAVPEQATKAQILQVLCDTEDFADFRLKPNERQILRKLNTDKLIKFPVQGTVTSTSHKISLIVQLALGPTDSSSALASIRMTLQKEQPIIFDRMQRLLRCVIDCKVVDKDGSAVNNALDLLRSLDAKCWEGSALQLQQIAKIGPAAAGKLATGGIQTIAQLASSDPATIERLLSRHPPTGTNFRDAARAIPAFTLRADIVEKLLRVGEVARIQIKLTVTAFSRLTRKHGNKDTQPVSVWVTVSSGSLALLWRGQMHQLEDGQVMSCTAVMELQHDFITCYAAADRFVGTLKSVVVRPELPTSTLPLVRQPETTEGPPIRLPAVTPTNQVAIPQVPYDLDDTDDAAMLEAAEEAERRLACAGPSCKIGVIDNPAQIGGSDVDLTTMDVEEGDRKSTPSVQSTAGQEQMQLRNGKWRCNHECAGRVVLQSGKLCKHKCCKDGVDRPNKRKPKPTGNTTVGGRAVKKRKGIARSRASTQARINKSMRPQSRHGEKSGSEDAHLANYANHLEPDTSSMASTSEHLQVLSPLACRYKTNIGQSSTSGSTKHKNITTAHSSLWNQEFLDIDAADEPDLPPLQDLIDDRMHLSAYHEGSRQFINDDFLADLTDECPDSIASTHSVAVLSKNDALDSGNSFEDAVIDYGRCNSESLDNKRDSIVLNPLHAHGVELYNESEMTIMSDGRQFLVTPESTMFLRRMESFSPGWTEFERACGLQDLKHICELTPEEGA